LANIILSSTSEFPPGLHKVHCCAHKPCKEIASSVGSLLGVRGAPLHLFAIDSGIAMRNVPQSRNACEASAISALFTAVAEPSPPSPPDEHPEDIHNFHVDLAYAHVDEGSDGEPIPDKKEWQTNDAEPASSQQEASQSPLEPESSQQPFDEYYTRAMAEFSNSRQPGNFNMALANLATAHHGPLWQNMARSYEQMDDFIDWGLKDNSKLEDGK
jgi:hypothetical protein